MKEEIVQYIWASGIFNGFTFFTSEGEQVKIIDVGKQNFSVGPDFLHGKVFYKNMQWIGHVEIHTEAKLWYAHKHHLDKVYDRVVLHVVMDSPKDTYSYSGTKIPCISLRSHLSDSLINSFASQFQMDYWPRCNPVDLSVKLPIWKNLVPDLLRQRLLEKCNKILIWKSDMNGDWQQLMFITLAAALGGPANAIPFQRIATSIELPKIIRFRRDPERIEALLFGLAGWLNGLPVDHYMEMLQREFSGISSLIAGNDINVSAWQHGKVRPGARPARRMAVLVSMLSYPHGLLDLLDISAGPEQLERKLALELPEYWQAHFDFGKQSKQKWNDKISLTLRRHIIINVAVPFYFTYAYVNNNTELMQSAVNILNNLPAENNEFTGKFADAGWKPLSASESQAMIHLGRHFCSAKKCLLCAVGCHWLSSQKLMKNEY
jgi:hypothetical protein